MGESCDDISGFVIFIPEHYRYWCKFAYRYGVEQE